jgi:hypothetical protein
MDVALANATATQNAGASDVARIETNGMLIIPLGRRHFMPAWLKQT